jgi:hypothetical protein
MAAACSKGFIVLKRQVGSRLEYRGFPSRCKKWSCPICREKRSQHHKLRINSFFGKDQLWFYTLTFKHNLPEKQAWQKASIAWNKLNTSLHKRYGNYAYVRVLESHSTSCYPHYHFLVNRFFPAKEFGSLLLTSGFGFQARVARVSGVGAGGYISKYFVKGWPREDAQKIREELGLRVVNYSRNFPHYLVPSGGWNFQSFSIDRSSAAARILFCIQVITLRGGAIVSSHFETNKTELTLDMSGYSPPDSYYIRPENNEFKFLTLPERFDLCSSLGINTDTVRSEYIALCRARYGMESI